MNALNFATRPSYQSQISLFPSSSTHFRVHAAGLTVADLCGKLCTSQKGVLRLSNLKACKIAHMPISGSHLRLVCFGYGKLSPCKLTSKQKETQFFSRQ